MEMYEQNRNTNGKSTIILFVVFGIFFIAGIAVMIGGYKLWQQSEHSVQNGDETIAEITDIQKVRKSTSGRKREYTYHVYVKYSYNGQFYEGELRYYNSNMEIGDEVTIYVNPDNPTDIIEEDVPMFVLVIMEMIGGIFTIIGLVGLITGMNKKFWKSKYKMENIEVFDTKDL